MRSTVPATNRAVPRSTMLLGSGTSGPLSGEPWLLLELLLVYAKPVVVKGVLNGCDPPEAARYVPPTKPDPPTLKMYGVKPPTNDGVKL